MNLQLPLKKKWFEMTKSGVKKEDYREITAYWCVRLLTHNGEPMPLDFWNYAIFDDGVTQEAIKFLIKKCPAKNFSTNTMTLGYPKSNDLSRILKLSHKGIEIRTGNTEWGAEPDKLYFVIKHGEIK